MAIGGFVMNASVGYNYIRGEFMEPFKRFEGALKEAYTAGLLGKDIDSPTFAGNGGLNLGCPFLPSSDSNNAVSSPQI
jgi:NADH:ubiquinone oxidoreductase subunit F (NADH-binding)